MSEQTAVEAAASTIPVPKKPKKYDRMRESLTALLAEANGLEITDEAHYEVVAQQGVAVKGELDDMLELLGHQHEVVLRGYQASLEFINGVKKPGEELLKVWRRKLGEFKQRQASEEAARARAERAAAEAAAAAERAREIEAAKEEGDDAAAAALEAAPVVAKAEHLPAADAAPVKVTGVGHGTTWKARLKGDSDAERDQSLRALCKAIGEGHPQASLTMIKFMPGAANRLAGQMKELTNVPGLEAYPEVTTSLSAKR